MWKISTSHSTHPFTTIFSKHNTQYTNSLTPHISSHWTTLTTKSRERRRRRRKNLERRNKVMASTSAVSMAMPLTYSSQKKVVPGSESFFKPLPLRPSKAVVAASKPSGRVQVSASMKEKVVTGLTAAALTASMMVPDVAEAAVTPSLKNFLLSIAAGGVVVVVIIGAVVGVSNFDPVKRG